MLNNKNITYAKLKDVCEFERGSYISNDDMTGGEIPVISGGEFPVGFTNKYNRDYPCITISSAGYAGKNILYHSERFWAYACLTLTVKKFPLNLKYLYYWLLTMRPTLLYLAHAFKKSFANIYAKDLYNLEIPIPSIQTQQYVVSILDQFNNLTTNLQDGIPAEIKLRKEQYHYYLKQLLTFNNQIK